MYNVPVHMSRHPLLCEYVHSMLVGCRTWILKAELEKLRVVVLSEQGRVVTSLVMEPRIDLSAYDARPAPDSSPPLPLRQLEEVLRDALVSIVATPVTVNVGSNSETASSFRILVETIEDAKNPTTSVDASEPSNSWVLADPFWRQEVATQEREVIPVKMAQASDCPLKMNLYMESTTKGSKH